MTARMRTPRIDLRSIILIFVFLLTPIPGFGGEFKISRYIEPNQMSNLFTRHVRIGIIKRIGLTDGQLHEIRDAIDPYRETLIDQITKLKDSRIEMVEVVTEASFEPELIRSASIAATTAELDLTLTIGRVIQDIRPILTEQQILEITEMMEEVRQASEVRFEDFSNQLLAGELLGLKPRTEEAGGRR